MSTTVTTIGPVRGARATGTLYQFDYTSPTATYYVAEGRATGGASSASVVLTLDPTTSIDPNPALWPAGFARILDALLG